MLQAVINRPGAHNAINYGVMDELEEIIDRIKSDKSIRSFILSGTGNTFISGGDLKEFHTIETREEARNMALRMHSILNKIEQLPCWTIAAVNGAAYGGGCEIMLAFDFRIASGSATFGFTQGKFFLPPGWGGLTRLVERVGRSTALHWLAERTIVDTDTALACKLIDRTAPGEKLIPVTLEWAKKLSLNGRDYIQTLKEGAFRYSKARQSALKAEIEPFTKFWVDERHHRRVEQFISKNDPDA